ncbi:thaumatin family protein [Whalleya microplaca]|nr:thaumatin family protein [Whalleya microplaca]
MHCRSRKQGRRCSFTRNKCWLAVGLALLSQVPQAAAIVFPNSPELYKFDHLGPHRVYPTRRRPLTKRRNPIPLIITNNCAETIWPGIATQDGAAPESHGFELGPGEIKNMTIGSTWQGRIWGRTNCTTSGDTATCMTGDCFGKLDCDYGGAVPVTLAEFDLAGGVTGTQSFYDISLVDGYNLPVGIVYHPAANTSYIPPNLANPSCIATAGYLNTLSRTGFTYTNSSYPMPYEQLQTNAAVADWCPWDLQAFPPMKPGDGVYPYPDDEIQRPTFDPCKSACAAFNSPEYCCTGEYDDPLICEPSLYSRNAKAICPDAYSYAFDDKKSTFILPSGGGWEIVFCPNGRSTNILATFGQEMDQIAQSGKVTPEILFKAMNLSYIESKHSAATCLRSPVLVVIARVEALCLTITYNLLLPPVEESS